MTNTTTSTLAVKSDQPFWNQQQLAALAQIGVQNAPPADLAVFLNFAQRTGLDPFARQIYMIGRNSQGGKKWTIQASIDGLRIVAERSGDYAGQVGPEYCGPDGQWRDTWTAPEPPIAARIGVLRNGFQAPLYAVAYYDEYVQTSNGQPTSMWASKPRLMLAKCAEALALRKAFPNDLAGLYTADEMGNAEVRSATIQTTHDEPLPFRTPQVTGIQVRVVEPIQVDHECSYGPGENCEQCVKDNQEAAANTNAATKAQLTAIAAMLNKCGIKESTQRHEVASKILNREITDGHQLSKSDAHAVIEQIKPLADSEDPKAAFERWNGAAQ